MNLLKIPGSQNNSMFSFFIIKIDINGTGTYYTLLESL